MAGNARRVFVSLRTKKEELLANRLWITLQDEFPDLDVCLKPFSAPLAPRPSAPDQDTPAHSDQNVPFYDLGIVILSQEYFRSTDALRELERLVYQLAVIRASNREGQQAEVLLVLYGILAYEADSVLQGVWPDNWDMPDANVGEEWPACLHSLLRLQRPGPSGQPLFQDAIWAHSEGDVVARVADQLAERLKAHSEGGVVAGVADQSAEKLEGQGPTGRSLVCQWIERNDTEAIKACLQQQQCPFDKHQALHDRHDGLNMLQHAAKQGKPDMVECIMQCVEAQYPGKVVEYALSRSDQEGSEGMTALHLALVHGSTDVVHRLLENARPADILPLLYANMPFAASTPTCAGTPLHVAASMGHREAVQELLNVTGKDLSVYIRLTWASGIRINGSIEDGCSALHTAVYNSNFDTVVCMMQKVAQYDAARMPASYSEEPGLLSSEQPAAGPKSLLHKVLTQTTTGSGYNVLHLLALTKSGSLETLQALFDCQQPAERLSEQRMGLLHDLVKVKDVRGNTPVELMVQQEKFGMLSQLMQWELGGHPTACGVPWHILTQLRVTMHGGVSHSIFELNDNFCVTSGAYPAPATLLHQAAALGHSLTVRWLLSEAKDDPHGRRWLTVQDSEGHNAWHLAARSGFKKVLVELAKYDRYLMLEPGSELVGTPEALLKEESPAEKWWQGQKADAAKFQRAKQIMVESCSGILVGSAVIASVSFTAVYNPPRSWQDTYLHTGAKGLVGFYWLNGLSLYCALASIILGAGMSLPAPSRSPRAELRSMVRWVFYTTWFLLLALIFFALAFAMAMLACVRRQGFVYWQMVGMVVGGGVVVVGCVAMVGRPLGRLLQAEDMIGKDVTVWEVLLGLTLRCRACQAPRCSWTSSGACCQWCNWAGKRSPPQAPAITAAHAF